MKSPLKSPWNKGKSLGVLKKIIPNGSVIHTFLFYDGILETELSKTKRFVVSHTNKYVNYEFWQCLFNDPERVSAVAEHCYPIENKNIFYVLQKNWLKYPDPFVRTGMYFLLNQSTDTAQITHGELIENESLPRIIRDIKDFKTQNFHLQFDKEEEFFDSINNIDTKCDYVFIPVGNFSMNLFEKGKEEGFEQTKVIHKNIKKFVDTTDRKVILLYKYSKQVTDFYKDCNQYIVDQWGRQTDSTKYANEVLIANF